MSNIAFIWPYAALLLLLLIPMWLFDKKRGTDDNFLQSPMVPLLKQLSKGRIKMSWAHKINWFLVVFWTCLVIALMRPQYVGEPLEITRDGRSLMLVLDISESMEAEDMQLLNRTMDRLTIAKHMMGEFIDKRRGDRIGLVVFGSEAFLHAPLSFDHPTIKQFLYDTQIGFAGPKTAIGDAIGLSVKKLLDQAEGEKLLVLLTDGQNNMGSLEPMQAANIAKKYGVKIYIIGLGASRMVVDGFFGPTAINPSLSLDEAEPEMKQLASMTGGKYFRAKDSDALKSIYADIDALEPVKSEPLVLIPRKELFYWPLLGAMVLIVMRVMSALYRNHAHASGAVTTRLAGSRK